MRGLTEDRTRSHVHKVKNFLHHGRQPQKTRGGQHADENGEWDGSNHPDQCSDFCLFTMPSTTILICSAIWSLAELSIKPAPRHSLNGSKLWLLDLGLRQHISFIRVNVTKPSRRRSAICSRESRPCVISYPLVVPLSGRAGHDHRNQRLPAINGSRLAALARPSCTLVRGFRANTPDMAGTRKAIASSAMLTARAAYT